MKLYNTLSRKVDDLEILEDKKVRMYSCGPTVYDHIHIGNLSAFIAADTLRRALQAAGYQVEHAMNFTDVDDKTIRRSAERYPDLSPEEALKKLTEEYSMIFLEDMKAIGNDVNAVDFVKATDCIEGMRELIRHLHKDGFAYITDDGVYFSIEKYKVSGKTYGQLLSLSSENTSSARIDNDEYDKESVHDFALWKKRKEGEPAWEFELDGHNLIGRPGWHIECSSMSAGKLGQPFDIHTGGVDLIFPHHENEIAQSTAGKDNPTYAKYFVHNEHLLVEGKKMSKSLDNFFTLRDIQEKGFDPLAFRLMVLQAHYRNQTNFSWENLEAAKNRLQSYRAMADLRFQPIDHESNETAMFSEAWKDILQVMQDDLSTPQVLEKLSSLDGILADTLISQKTVQAFEEFLRDIDGLLGLNLLGSVDITQEQKHQLQERQQARDTKQWEASDEIRNQLEKQGIGVRDTSHGQIWHRL